MEHPKRSYILHTSSGQELKEWVAKLTELVDLAKRDEHRLHKASHAARNRDDKERVQQKMRDDARYAKMMERQPVERLDHSP